MSRQNDFEYHYPYVANQSINVNPRARNSVNPRARNSFPSYPVNPQVAFNGYPSFYPCVPTPSFCYHAPYPVNPQVAFNGYPLFYPRAPTPSYPYLQSPNPPLPQFPNQSTPHPGARNDINSGISTNIVELVEEQDEDVDLEASKETPKKPRAKIMYPSESVESGDPQAEIISPSESVEPKKPRAKISSSLASSQKKKKRKRKRKRVALAKIKTSKRSEEWR